MTWTLVVPVKHTANGKSRLAPYLGRGRPELAHAMTLDTVQAALSAAGVGELIAITNDPSITRDLTAMGAAVFADEPDNGLNPALIQGAAIARGRRPDRGVAAMFSDLPALRHHQLEYALRAASEHPTAFVPDASGNGTTLYTALPGADFTPRFGLGSRTAHRATGAVELDLADIQTLRQDVDVEEDLDEAVGLGIGARTRQVLARLGALL